LKAKLNGFARYDGFRPKSTGVLELLRELLLFVARRVLIFRFSLKPMENVQERLILQCSTAFRFDLNGDFVNNEFGSQLKYFRCEARSAHFRLDLKSLEAYR
jgi:hypothetical protein